MPTRTGKSLIWIALALVVLGLVFSGAGHAGDHHDEGEHCMDCALALTSPPAEPVVVLPSVPDAELVITEPDAPVLRTVPTNDPVRGPPVLA